jgi:hypothetical protein
MWNCGSALVRFALIGHKHFACNSYQRCLRDMRRSGGARNDRPVRWTGRLTVLSVVLMFGILALFYATDQKPLAMRLMRVLNPISSILPWVTQNMRPTAFTVRLYDFLVVVAMAIQGCLVGSIVDFIRWFRRRGLPNRSSPDS